MLEIEGFYIWVSDLDEAIDFYQRVFQRKIVNRERNRWADFGDQEYSLFGIYNYTVDEDQRSIPGNNITPEVRTKDIKKEHKRIKALTPKSITKIFTLTQPVLYKYFHFEDRWGNIWEVTEHYYE